MREKGEMKTVNDLIIKDGRYRLKVYEGLDMGFGDAMLVIMKLFLQENPFFQYLNSPDISKVVKQYDFPFNNKLCSDNGLSVLYEYFGLLDCELKDVNRKRLVYYFANEEQQKSMKRILEEMEGKKDYNKGKMTEDKIRKEILKQIRKFSEKRDWKLGLRHEYVINNVIGKLRVHPKIIDSLIQKLFDEKIIYYRKSYNNIYWIITKAYR